MKIFRDYIKFCLLVGLWLGISSHVGSPGVIYEGMLGPYRVMANVNPPDVIPGIALVTVILPDNPDGISLEAKPVYWSAGLSGTPISDPLIPVEGEIGKYELELWFMGAGASSVQLILSQGDRVFETTIPVMALPTAQKDMPVNLGLILSALGLFLVILMVTIIASAMSDSLRSPGVPREKSGNARKTKGVVIGTICMLLILWGGKSWWDNEADSYLKNIYKPIAGNAWVESSDQGNFLELTIDKEQLQWGSTVRKMSYIVPDHGKLMHLFLIRKDDLDVFAHLHPQRIDSLHFRSVLPDLPAGDYHVFADFTRFTGFSETIVSDLTIPENTPFRLISERNASLDRDDSFLISSKTSSQTTPNLLDADFLLCGKPGMRIDLAGGYGAMWQSETEDYKAGKLYSLDFELFDPEGNPANLEPYLGMMGHAVAMKYDGSVYIHLHPTGNYSMGSQEMLLERFASGKTGFGQLPTGMTFMDSVDQVISWMDQLPIAERDSLLMGNGMHNMPEDPEHEGHQMVSFPYAFPEGGDFRVWIQVKIDGQILNGAFDVAVSD
ncbi:hypothetical protein [Lunatibacter salilacus]|uniref:hypothetical protein n=1 Tax=Lunatibacter salilacus TaxID=2483804 RepID=UPI00131B01F8|nr:hypothetical protein [Lunatibacter salilacus]